MPEPDATPLPSSEPSSTKKRGRKQTTGRYDSREALLERIWFQHQRSSLSAEAIGRLVGVSQMTVLKILQSGEGRAEP
ncbi:hypothetical protein WDL1P1_00291 (plasmid) [Variovorax sp. WDL1]|nr:hypothetical protein CHC06_05871 [Variovorax sp. B2]PNG51121.1 hypothetical protein CHC07_05777 [Variovorax sp. B4]VTV17318.1 hypothetical protein WDL1P1_00291 [Variovorax sp. WDL1]